MLTAERMAEKNAEKVAKNVVERLKEEKKREEKEADIAGVIGQIFVIAELLQGFNPLTAELKNSDHVDLMNRTGEILEALSNRVYELLDPVQG